MHKLADSITRSVRIPFLHIVDSTAAAIKQAGHTRVGLLATRFTMEEPFYAGRMRDRFEVDVIVPSPASRQIVHDIIYQELCLGVVRRESREKYIEVIRELGRAGAQSIILGCTEIELLLSAEDSTLPMYPSTSIHATAAVDFALQ
jgi:aspartate racemase